MHELLRQYAASRLDAEPTAVAQTRRAHADYFLGFLAERGPWLKGPRQMDALADIDADIDNITAAWGWACAADVMALPVEAVDALGRFYAMRARQQEGEHAMQQALDRVAVNVGSPLAVNHAHPLATLYTWLAHFAGDLGLNDVAAHALAQGFSVLDAVNSIADDLQAVRAGLLIERTRQAQDRDDAQRYASQAVQLLRSVDQPWLLAGALREYGKYRTLVLEDSDDGPEQFAESWQIYEALGDREKLCDLAIDIGFDALLRGNFDLALEMAQRAVGLAADLASPIRLSGGQWLLSWVLEYSGRYQDALPLAEAALVGARAQGSTRNVAMASTTVADILVHLGRNVEADVHLQNAWKIVDDNLWHASFLLWCRGEVQLALRHADAAADLFSESIALHRQLHDNGRIHDVIIRWGFTAFAQEETILLAECLAQSAAAANAERRWMWAIEVIALAALAALMDARPARAVELYALAETFPRIANSAFFDEVAGRHVRAAAATLAPDVADAARQRGAELDLWATVEALAHEYAAALPPDTSGSP